MTLTLAYDADTGGLCDDGPPWIGRAALAVGAVSVAAGMLLVAGTLAGAAWLHGRLHRG